MNGPFRSLHFLHSYSTSILYILIETQLTNDVSKFM